MFQCRVISDENPVFRGRCRNFGGGKQSEANDANSPDEQIALLWTRHANSNVRLASIEGRAPGYTRDRQGDVGMHGTKGSGVRSDKMGSDGRWRTHLDGGRKAVDGTFRIATDGGDILFHARHEFRHGPPVRRQRRTARAAVDEAEIQHAFEVGNSPTDRRMVDAEFAGRGRQRARAGERSKMKKVLPVDHPCIIAQMR